MVGMGLGVGAGYGMKNDMASEFWGIPTAGTKNGVENRDLAKLTPSPCRSRSEFHFKPPQKFKKLVRGLKNMIFIPRGPKKNLLERRLEK